MKQILIVEDEFSIAIDIEQRLINLGYDVLDIALNYDEAIEAINKHQHIDLILLDINLEDKKSGIDLGYYIQQNVKVPIIYITAYLDDKTFDSAKKTNPMAYINKPIKDLDLKHAVELAIDRNADLQASLEKGNESNSEYVFIKDKGQIKKVKIADILWLEAMDNYTVIHLSDEKHITNSFLKDVISTLGSDFVRIHRSHAVAFSQVSKIEDNSVYLGNKHLTISKSYKSGLMNRLNLI